MLQKYKNIVRTLIKFIGVFILSLLIYFGPNANAFAQTNRQTPHVRKEAHTSEAQSDLTSLEAGMEKLRALDCSNPLSWYYQGGIHWVPTTNAEMSGLAQNPLCPSYTQAMDQLKDTWDNCTHDMAGNSEIHFLAWHRLFIYHFEKVIRAMSNNPNFALPYWGYVNLDTTDVNSPKISLTMPSGFITPANSGNSLFERARFSGLRQGNPIDQSFAQSFLVDAVEDLNKQIPFEDFNRSMDQAPHGLMHVYIGGGNDLGNPEIMFNPIYNRQDAGLMHNVPSAGFDPIFWLHHGNVDRLWEQWNQSENGEKVTLDQLKSVQWPYVFFEPDSSSTQGWKKVSYTPEQVIDMIYNMDYVYDSQPAPIVANALEATENKTPRSKTRLISRNTDAVVRDVPVNVEITLPSETRRNLEFLRSGRTEAPSTPNGYALEITVSYTGRPTGFYNIYVNLPTEGAINDRQSYAAGAMVFFVVESDRPVTRTFRFDVTNELLSQLEREGENMNTQSLAVSIAKEGGQKNEEITVKNVSLYSY